jgi:hypothetical protein
MALNLLSRLVRWVKSMIHIRLPRDVSIGIP